MLRDKLRKNVARFTGPLLRSCFYKGNSGSLQPTPAGEIWKRSFISAVRTTAHANASRTSNGSFWKRSSNQRNFKTLAFRVRLNGKYFENGAFRKWWHHDVIFLTEFFLNTNPEWLVSVALLTSENVDGKHFLRFQIETSVFKFFWGNVEGKHLMRFHSETSVFKFLPA